ncbi:hypothetical protein LCGC14_1215490 [marine sediment metagenome]|uniref:Uncharacterized protein n=1 Tax=marine sediment metagenome TaxID=412755 RepID=A0A0F9PHE2_9ZZZZ
MIEAAIVLFTVFTTAIVTGTLSGPGRFGERLFVLMLTSGFIGGAIALLALIAWRL